MPDIILRAHNGQYVSAVGGGGYEVVANRVDRGPFETFTAERVTGSSRRPFRTGDSIALRTFNGSYVCAEGGGGGYVVADRADRGPWETFEIELR